MQATNIIASEISEVTSGNTTFNTYLPQWKFLLESYMGGEDYRRGSHLIRYKMETDAEYSARLRNTPLENHCKSIIGCYISFLFREEPVRDLMGMENYPEIESLLEDADYEGRSINNFMKEVAVWSSVFGHCYVVCSKPNVGAITQADEQAVGLRPYLSILTPLVVLDWRYERTPVGRYQLNYIKYIEDVNGDLKTVKEWDAEQIITTIVDESKKKIVSQQVEVNGLGIVPVVIAYTNKSIVRGIGVSDITDIADAQKFIYNCTSEIDQSIRLDSHPSLVTTTEVQVGTGAGAIITMPDNMDPSLKPYVLEFGGANVNSILETIRHTTEIIDKMANTGSIRTTETRDASGIAIQTEFELLNSRLSEKADNLELAEEQIWQIIALYQGQNWAGSIEYPDSFNIRDRSRELQELKSAREVATDPAILQMIDHELMEVMDFEYEDVGIEEEEHAETTPEDRQAHIQQMIMDGYTDEEILSIHPEIQQQDIDSAKRNLLELG